MSKIDTGGSVFPLENAGTEFQAGITFRDYVATAMAPHFMDLMQTLSTNEKIASKDAARFAALAAYEFADAMVAARGEVPR